LSVSLVKETKQVQIERDIDKRYDNTFYVVPTIPKVATNYQNLQMM